MTSDKLGPAKLSQAKPSQKALDTIANLRQALSRLEEGLAKTELSYLEKAGVIKTFEFVYELTWTSLKLLLEAQGHVTQSARQAFSLAYNLGWIQNDEVWAAMIKDRNLTVHTYDEEFATITEGKVRSKYFPLFKQTLKMIDEQVWGLGKKLS